MDILNLPGLIVTYVSDDNLNYYIKAQTIEKPFYMVSLCVLFPLYDKDRPKELIFSPNDL